MKIKTFSLAGLFTLAALLFQPLAQGQQALAGSPILARGQEQRQPGKTPTQTAQKQGEVLKITGKNRSLNAPRFRAPAQLKLPAEALTKLLKIPPVMSTAMKLKMTGDKGSLAPYAALSLKNLSAAGKAELLFFNPLFISAGDSGEPLALVGASVGSLVIRVNAESANSLYLVDLAVTNTALFPNAVTTFSVYEVGDTEQQKLEIKNGHVIFLLNAPETGWYEFIVKNDNVGWVLHSCTVSALK